MLLRFNQSLSHWNTLAECNQLMEGRINGLMEGWKSKILIPACYPHIFSELHLKVLCCCKLLKRECIRDLAWNTQIGIMNTRTIPIWAFHTTLWSQINYLVVVKNLDFKRFLYISLQSGQLLQGPDAKTATKTPFSLSFGYLFNCKCVGKFTLQKRSINSGGSCIIYCCVLFLYWSYT